jgi:hypothetical protein
MENASLSLEYPFEALTDAKLANSFALTEQVSSRSDSPRLRTHAHLFARRLCVCFARGAQTTSLAATPNGCYVIAGFSTGTVRVFNAMSNQAQDR